MSNLTQLTEATKLVSHITKSTAETDLYKAANLLASVKVDYRGRELLNKNVKRLTSLSGAIKDREIGYSAVKRHADDIATDMVTLSHVCIDMVVGDSQFDVTEASVKKPTVLKDFSQLGHLLDTLKPIQKHVKGVESANGVDSRTDDEKKDWEEYDASQYAYEEGLHKGALEQKSKLDRHAESLPPYSKIKNAISHNGWSIFKAPVLVVFSKAPTRTAIQRSRIKIDHLNMSSNLAEKIKNDVSRIGSIVEDQMILALPSILTKDKDKFEEEKELAVNSLSSRLGDLLPVTRAPISIEKVKRATDFTKVSFDHIKAPVEPVKPVAPSVEKKNGKIDPSSMLKYSRAKKAYDKAMSEYVEKEAKYKEDLKAYKKEFKSNSRLLEKAKNSEREKLRVSRDEYFSDKKYPGMVFIWLMPKTILHALMPMAFSLIAFPSTGDITPPKEYLEERKNTKEMNEMLVPTQQALANVLSKIDTVQKESKKKVSTLTALEVSLNSAMRSLQKINPKTAAYTTALGTIENIKLSIMKVTREIENIHSADIPAIQMSINSLKSMTKELLEHEKR